MERLGEMVKVLTGGDMATVYLSLGSNLGNRAQHLKNAISHIQQEVGEVLAKSSIHENDAVGFCGNRFLNQVVKVETELSPISLLTITQRIEYKLGRVQKSITKNSKPVFVNRIIDIDILLYDDIQIDTKTLSIPHPRMLEREFVMKPLKELFLNPL